MDVISTSVAGASGIEKVVVHPLVLLSIVDNYNRVAKDTRKRVLGVLLGATFRGRVDITNSYAGWLLSQKKLGLWGCVDQILFRREVKGVY